MWTDNILNNINTMLANKEADKLYKKETSNKISTNTYDNSSLFTITEEEKKILSEFKKKMVGYFPRSAAQKSILMFASLGIPIDRIKYDDNMKKYLEASNYWSKYRYTASTTDPYGKNIRYINKELELYIYQYEKDWVISTKSTILNLNKEGKI